MCGDGGGGGNHVITIGKEVGEGGGGGCCAYKGSYTIDKEVKRVGERGERGML